MKIDRKLKATHYEVIATPTSVSAPSCVHGPALLFRREPSGEHFFACSACRSRKDCSLYVTMDDWKRRVEKGKTQLNVLSTCKTSEAPPVTSSALMTIIKQNYGIFCDTCQQMSVSEKGHEAHSHRMVTMADLRQPSCVLEPREASAGQAQYWFTAATLTWLRDLLVQEDVTRLLCVGCPRVHETVKLRSFLLDIDERYSQFYPASQFARFNMFNSHTFGGSLDQLDKFLSTEEKTAIIVDPPFGGMVEPIADTVKQLMAKCSGDVELLFFFPYFNEKKITSSLSGLRPAHYRVMYQNHGKFVKDSPVRCFTTVPLSRIKLPADHYKQCESCNIYVHKETEHCRLCGSCAGMDGKKFRHCMVCRRCVRAAAQHCDSCSTCHKPDAACVEVGTDRFATASKPDKPQLKRPAKANTSKSSKKRGKPS